MERVFAVHATSPITKESVILEVSNAGVAGIMKRPISCASTLLGKVASSTLCTVGLREDRQDRVLAEIVKSGQVSCSRMFRLQVIMVLAALVHMYSRSVKLRWIHMKGVSVLHA